MDEVTGLVAGGGLIASRDLVTKLLGPSAEYVGQKALGLLQKADVNVNDIFRRAIRFLGPRLDAPGGVPPRVVQRILMEGAFCEDQLAAEYFGGVLASSRSEVPRDDRAATLVALLGRLSTYQIRAHFIVYRAMKASLTGDGISKGNSAILIREESFLRALDLSENEDAGSIVSHALHGLSREGLVVQGDIESYFSASKDGLVFEPSAAGIELALWANGLGHVKLSRFFNPDVLLEGQGPKIAIEGVTVLMQLHSRGGLAFEREMDYRGSRAPGRSAK
jgi:hypothetical protein